jgi:hypothetical protein
VVEKPEQQEDTDVDRYSRTGPIRTHGHGTPTRQRFAHRPQRDPHHDRRQDRHTQREHDDKGEESAPYEAHELAMVFVLHTPDQIERDVKLTEHGGGGEDDYDEGD